jgi:hypothetical protein
VRELDSYGLVLDDAGADGEVLLLAGDELCAVELSRGHKYISGVVSHFCSQVETHSAGQD